MTPFPFEISSYYVQFSFLLISAFLLACFVWYLLFVKVRDWGKTKAVVIKNVWKKGNADRETSGSVDLLYEYVVEGKKYKNNKVGIRDCAFSLPLVGQNPGLARVVHFRIKSQKEIWIYYDRNNPSISCLDISIDKGLLIFLIALSSALLLFVVC